MESIVRCDDKTSDYPAKRHAAKGECCLGLYTLKVADRVCVPELVHLLEIRR